VHPSFYVRCGGGLEGANHPWMVGVRYTDRKRRVRPPSTCKAPVYVAVLQNSHKFPTRDDPHFQAAHERQPLCKQLFYMDLVMFDMNNARIPRS
jgi:hypothetical protein